MPSPEFLPLTTLCPEFPCDFPLPDTIPLWEPPFCPLAVATPLPLDDPFVVLAKLWFALFIPAITGPSLYPSF